MPEPRRCSSLGGMPHHLLSQRPARRGRHAAELIRVARAHAAAAILVIMAAGVPEALAAHPAKGVVCVSRMAVVGSPGGFTVGYAFRGDRVRVARRSANGRWAQIRTADELRGWARASALCQR